MKTDIKGVWLARAKYKDASYRLYWLKPVGLGRNWRRRYTGGILIGSFCQYNFEKEFPYLKLKLGQCVRLDIKIRRKKTVVNGKYWRDEKSI